MFLTAGLCFCAWTDQKWSRVSNEALMLLAFVGVMEWGMGFITGALPFLLFGMLLFRFRVMGAGDGKLMAVIGGYLGIQSGFYAVGFWRALSGVCGGSDSLAWRRNASAICRSMSGQ